jgi:hypothetical protein
MDERNDGTRQLLGPDQLAVDEAAEPALDLDRREFWPEPPGHGRRPVQPKDAVQFGRGWAVASW